MKNRIGIFGGTFDPVHNGHVAIAEDFIKKFSLDRLYIIPNNVSPLKARSNVSGEDRFKMLEIAFGGNQKAVVSDIELKRQGPSYTWVTVYEIRVRHPESEIFLLTGDDWIGSFDKWKEFLFILNNAHLVVATRSGEDITAELDRLESLSGKRPRLLKNRKVELSSTEFRADGDGSHLPKGVFEYIKEQGLYGL